MNITVIREYVTTAQADLEMATTSLHRRFAPDEYIDEKLDSIRIYLAQVLIELGTTKKQSNTTKQGE